jgi:hypothetical protein
MNLAETDLKFDDITFIKLINFRTRISLIFNEE